MKYKLTNNTKKILDTTFYQIEALKDFWYVKKWDLGWWLEKEENLSQDWNAWVFWDARVYWNAEVYWNAWVYWNAEVYWNAWVYWDARVFWDAEVYWNARVYWDAEVYWNARVFWKYNYIKWWFIWWDDTGKITNITNKMWTDYWKAQYVLWDYEITPQEEEKQTVTLELTEEQLKQIKEQFNI